jgi:RNA-binding protein YlmH
MDKNTLINRCARDDEERIKLARLFDMSARRDRKNIVVSGPFFSEEERLIAEDMMKASGETSFFFWGGFDGAERQCPIFLPEYLTEDSVKEDISLASMAFIQFTADGYNSDVPITHRDVLGSLMGLGIERETVGDILCEKGRAAAAVRESILPFVLESLDRIGRTPVSCRVCAEIPFEVKRECEDFFDTVASLRLDSVVASAFSLSRAEASAFIERGLVFLNGRNDTKTSRTVEKGDRISLRGKGKCEIADLAGETKKGRLKILIRRYK